jgi:dihydroorotase
VASAETGTPRDLARRRISTALRDEILRRAKSRGVPVSAEATPHHIALTEEALVGYDTNLKMNPPLRSRADREALVAGIQDGTIEVIATDHAPHTAAEKARGLAGSAMGIVGLETAFPLLYKYLVLEGVITLEKLVALMSANPRRIFALEGGVEEGDAADFTVLDLGAEYAVDPGTFLSKGRATPFAGWKVQGRAVLTVVGGKEVYDDNYESNR